MTSYWLGREFEWMSVFEICRSLSSKATSWHWRGHRLLRVALSEISGLSPKWSFATDTQRISNIRKRIRPTWRFWSVAWPNLIKDFLDVQIIKIKNACFWQWRKFQAIHCTCSKVVDENIGNLVVRLFVISLLTFRYFSTIVSLFGAGAAPFLRLRLRANRLGGSRSGSGSDQNVSAPAPHPWLKWFHSTQPWLGSRGSCRAKLLLYWRVRVKISTVRLFWAQMLFWYCGVRHVRCDVIEPADRWWSRDTRPRRVTAWAVGCWPRANKGHAMSSRLCSGDEASNSQRRWPPRVPRRPRRRSRVPR